MSILVILVFSTVTVCTASKQDLALTPRTSGEAVVDDVVKRIQDSGIFADDHGFLKRVAIAESRMGLNTYTYKHSGGIWQVDRKSAFAATKDIKSHPDLEKTYENIKEKFNGLDWRKVEYEDLKKPLYSGLAARIYLARLKGAIPSTFKGQSVYWKLCYNGEGDGSPEKFIERVQVYEKVTTKIKEKSSTSCYAEPQKHKYMYYHFTCSWCCSGCETYLPKNHPLGNYESVVCEKCDVTKRTCKLHYDLLKEDDVKWEAMTKDQLCLGEK